MATIEYYKKRIALSFGAYYSEAGLCSVCKRVGVKKVLVFSDEDVKAAGFQLKVVAESGGCHAFCCDCLTN